MAVGFPENSFYYDKQIKSCIIQFMAIFTGLKVQVGKKKTGEYTEIKDCNDQIVDTQPVVEDESLISVPVYYGAMDRVVAAFFTENTQNKPLRLPLMSAYLRSIELAKNRMSGTGFERRHTYAPMGGLIPDDLKVVHQRMPVPYELTFDLAIFTSNTDQQFQILEQILLLFDPQLEIQTSDAPFDWSRMTAVELIGINNEQNFPVSGDRRIIQITLQFKVIMYLSAPASIRKDFVEKVLMRIGAVSSAAENNYDIIAELDSQGLQYEEIWTINSLPFK